MKSKYILLLLSGIICTCSYCQDTAAIMGNIVNAVYEEEKCVNSDFDFFSSEEELQIALSFDMREFLRSKSRPKYYDAILTVKINAGDSITQPIKIKARGEMRRTYCSFPPLMLKFKNGSHGTGRIRGNGTVKLVTHCNQSPVSEGYVFKEYLAYKLFNLVTPYSFKTRLVRINYVDINRPVKAFTAYGFLIENEDKMAERNNAVVIDNPNITQKHMNAEDMARVAIFNYMIGNTDWSVPFQHNIKVLKSLKVLSEKGIPVAYDFDYSGFVNTGYSAPSEVLPIKTVTERHYLGFCFSDDELKPVIEEFTELKKPFISTINDFDYLSKGAKKQAESYINSFYKQIKYHNMLMSDLNRTCKRF